MIEGRKVENEKSDEDQEGDQEGKEEEGIKYS